MMIEAVRNAISKLTDEEKNIVTRLYYDEENLRAVAEAKKISDLSFMTILIEENKI